MKNVTVLIDLNNLLFRRFFIKEIAGYTPSPEYKLWKYMVLEDVYRLICSIENVKEVVLASDDKNSWRKSYFPRYKESRKKNRDKQSDVDWERLFLEIDKFISDLKHYMPFKTMRSPSAEADDIIAVICKESNKNCVISSNDEDFLQLCSDKVKLWNPSKKEYIVCNNVESFIIEKCLIGQKKDDIFNVVTPDNWGLTNETKGKRKPGFGPKSAKKIMSGDYKKWLQEKNLEENFHRNKVLMDFNYIPQTIIKRILKSYKNYSFPPPSNIYEYFKKNNMKGFLDNYTFVEARLMTLY